MWGMWQELEAHCFVHIVEIDRVVNYVVPSFPVFEATRQHVRYRFVEEDDGGLIYSSKGPFHRGKRLYPKTLPLLLKCFFRQL